MKRFPKIIALAAAACMAFGLAGCADINPEPLVSYETYTPSDGLEKGGYWKDVKALEHVELCDYEGMKIPSDVYTVTDEALQQGLNELLSEFMEPEKITNRAVKNGDTVNIDYIGSVDGVEFTGGSTAGQGTDVTIGVTQYIDDFLEQLIGHMPGDSFDIEVTFPDNYHEASLKGRDAVFKTQVNYIVGEKKNPELTNEFITKNFAGYGWKNEDDLKNAVRANLSENSVRNYICKYLHENSRIKSTPQLLTDYQKASLLNYYYSYAKSSGMDLEAFVKQYLGYESSDALLEHYKENWTEAAELNLLLQAASEKEGISVSSDDVAEYFRRYYGTEDYSSYAARFGEPYLYFTVLQQMTADRIAEKAVTE